LVDSQAEAWSPVPVYDPAVSPAPVPAAFSVPPELAVLALEGRAEADFLAEREVADFFSALEVMVDACLLLLFFQSWHLGWQGVVREGSTVGFWAAFAVSRNGRKYTFDRKFDNEGGTVRAGMSAEFPWSKRAWWDAFEFQKIPLVRQSWKK
jgi:hypothetical protein